MKKTYIYAATSIFLWSTVATVTKLLLGSFNSFQILAVSTFFGALFLLAVNTVTGNIKKLKEYRLKDYLTTVLIGLPGTFFYYIFYYTGASMMPASQAFIVNYLWPIMSVAFACLLLKEKLTLRKGIAIGLSFVGVMIVTGKDLLQFRVETLLGALLCILGAVSYGAFTALTRKVQYDKRISMMLYYTTSFVLTTVINLVSGAAFTITPVQILGLAWNGMFCIATASTLWLYALSDGQTARVSNLAYITPFLSLVWTGIFLKEELSVYSVAGLLVIMLGIFIQLKEKRVAEK